MKITECACFSSPQPALLADTRACSIMGHAVYAIFILKQPRLWQTDCTIVLSLARSLAIKTCCCYHFSIVYPCNFQSRCLGKTGATEPPGRRGTGVSGGPRRSSNRDTLFGRIVCSSHLDHPSRRPCHSHRGADDEQHRKPGAPVHIRGRIWVFCLFLPRCPVLHLVQPLLQTGSQRISHDKPPCAEQICYYFY